MKISNITHSGCEAPEPAPSLLKDHFRVLTPQGASMGENADTPLYLVTLDRGIGDAVSLGSSVIDQIIWNDRTASGKIDVLCNAVQSGLFRYDPRVNRIIETPLTFFPSAQPSSWYKLVAIEHEARDLFSFLRERCYEAVFPSIIAPALYVRLRVPLMLPNLPKLVNDLFIAGLREDRPLRYLVRDMVNRYFGRDVAASELPESASLYLSKQEMQKAKAVVEMLKRQASTSSWRKSVLVVAPDSASPVSRPPTTLLAASLTLALERCPGLILCLLPSYTDSEATARLAQALRAFDDRLFEMPGAPGMTLLETAALLDQSDSCLTGDTGIMHLAAAVKKIRPLDDSSVTPSNAVHIIALFGGTSPGFYGYRRRSIILGDGRKEQHSFRPGFSKEAYSTKGRDFFDHIRPEEVSEAICRCVADQAKRSA
jgi:ADP-heptose:LPS heptosyltransferase